MSRRRRRYWLTDPKVETQDHTRLGPFAVEATIPTPVDFEGDGIEDSGVPEDASYIDRMIEALRRNPSFSSAATRPISLENVRHASPDADPVGRGELESDDEPVALVFGPENGAVSEKLVYEAARRGAHEALPAASRDRLRDRAERSRAGREGRDSGGHPGHLRPGDARPGDGRPAEDDAIEPALLRLRPSRRRAAQGRRRRRRAARNATKSSSAASTPSIPTTSEATHRDGNDVPAWLLDTAWNGLSFHVSQAFFPRTSAWENLKKALKTDFEESVWDHLSGTVPRRSRPATHDEIAVKVIDDRGNELLVVKSLDEAE